MNILNLSGSSDFGRPQHVFFCKITVTPRIKPHFDVFAFLYLLTTTVFSRRCWTVPNKIQLFAQRETFLEGKLGIRDMIIMPINCFYFVAALGVSYFLPKAQISKNFLNCPLIYRVTLKLSFLSSLLSGSFWVFCDAMVPDKFCVRLSASPLMSHDRKVISVEMVSERVPDDFAVKAAGNFCPDHDTAFLTFPIVFLSIVWVLYSNCWSDNADSYSGVAGCFWFSWITRFWFALFLLNFVEILIKRRSKVPFHLNVIQPNIGKKLELL